MEGTSRDNAAQGLVTRKGLSSDGTMSVVEWQATDQFGNLYVGESTSSDVDGLLPEIESLIDELAERSGSDFSVTIDFDYGEVCGPDPESVSHVIRAPWLKSCDRGPVTEAVRNVVHRRAGPEVAVNVA